MPKWSRAVWMGILAAFLALMAVFCVGGIYFVIDEIEYRLFSRNNSDLGLLAIGITSLGFALVAFGCVLSLGRMLPGPGKKDE